MLNVLEKTRKHAMRKKQPNEAAKPWEESKGLRGEN